MARLAALACVAVVLAVPSIASAAEAPQELWTTCTTGSGAAQCSIPRGIAADPNTGHLFVADSGNSRIDEFTAWGEFVKAWGWDVSPEGAPGDTASNQLEICSILCQAGSEGVGAGQFGHPQGVALDSSGDVYVVDKQNLRVQKFDPEGHFVLTFGGEVNKTASAEVGSTETERNLCTTASGDECGIGTTGNGNGQFAWSSGAAVGSFIAIGPADKVWIAADGRIQRFDTAGVYQGQVQLPEPGPAGAVAADPNTGELYFSYGLKDFLNKAKQPSVLKLNSTTGEVLDTLEVDRPQTLAVDSNGALYVFDDQINLGTSNIHVPPSHPSRILKFDPDGQQIAAFVEDEFESGSTGIAINTVDASGEMDFYVANGFGSNSFVRAYGPAPVNWAPPPAVAPSIESIFAISVVTESATLKAQINPHFWDDTRYYVQYGTSKCSEGGCEQSQPAPPGSLLTKKVANKALTSAGVILSGLEPDTTYHYRFVAESGGGGPVYGLERTFHTFPLPAAPDTNCPNQQFRIGPSAGLADCRAYEMVTPSEKNGDVRGVENLGHWARLYQATPDGGKITYSATFSAFGEPAASPVTPQYLASRDPQDGWLSHSISAPRKSESFYFTIKLEPLFKAFSPDLCKGWFLQDTDLALAPGAVSGLPNLYKVDLCGEAGYEPLTTVDPSNPELTGLDGYLPNFKGASADGTTSVFHANAAYPEDHFQLFATDGPENVRLLSVLPDDTAADGDASVGTRYGFPTTLAEDSVRHAVSADGSRVFWSSGGSLYLRLNPVEEQSAFAHGTATGTGSLTEGSNKVTQLKAAEGKANFTKGSPTVTLLETSVGKFVAGQPVSAPAAKLPVGTTIVEVSGQTLTLSAPAGESGSSKTIFSSGPMPFAVGQTLVGAGIPSETTIAAIAAGSLTLSANAAQTMIGAKLSAFSDCTEPSKACTIEVAAAAQSSAAEFVAANPEGSRLIFTRSGNLYESDTDKAIAHEAGVQSLIATGVQGVMGVDEDASRIYFASSQDLGAGPNPQGDMAVPNKLNLYLYERGAGFSFVGTLLQQDTFIGTPASSYSPLATEPGHRSARVSPDGLHAAFASSAALTAYDNSDAASGNAAAEVYVYAAATEGEPAQLLCVSCNPSGARPHGRLKGFAGVGNTVELRAAAEIPGWHTEQQASRVLSDDGRRLFFDAYDALLPQDTNGARDVYEWQAPGSGDCDPSDRNFFAADGGCLSLISSGQSPIDSGFIEASADGSDVFFETLSSLLPGDPGLVDIYDARAGGGFPEAPGQPPACEGEACQAPPEAPNDPTPASESFEGAGNVREEPAAPAPKPCAKGKVRRHGKCVVRKHKKAARRAKHKRRAAR